MVSDGVTIDHTPPIAGIVVAGKINNTDFVHIDDTIYVHWSGFEDTVSGIKSYQVALCEKKNSSNCPLEYTDIGLQTNITLLGLWIFLFIFYLVYSVYHRKPIEPDIV